MSAPTVRGCPFGHGWADDAAAEVRRAGKHVLPTTLLDRLARVRAEGTDTYASALLDCLLDKRDGRFHNRTYLALDLLDRIMDESGHDHDGMAALLMADVVGHEERARAVDERVLRTRLTHARRFVAMTGLPAPLTGPAGEWFARTVHPVSTMHDEYFFIRALQCHEMLFTALTGHVLAAAAALRSGDADAAVARLDTAASVFDRTALLFRVVATISADAFHTFRAFTEGASAIQSEAYKRFEVACGVPEPARLASEAFGNVPTVVTHAVDLTSAYLDADPAQRVQLDAGIAELERRHQRWKTTHLGLAARLLGDAPGSGYTAGVPYLRACLDNRLFWRLRVAV